MTTAAERSAITRDVSKITVGDIRVVGVTVQDQLDFEGSYTLVAVRLSPPTGRTWDLDDFYAIRRTIRNAVHDVLGDDAEPRITFSAAQPAVT